jgi:hypothetical protein
MGWILPSVGCQVEYAGMTLPSGRYMHDDVQYFASGPDFPWANTQAASQRARMQRMGIEVPAGAPVPPGMIEPRQMQLQQGGRPVDINVQPMVPGPGGPVPAQPLPPGAGQLPNVPVPGAAQPQPQPPAPGEVPPPAGSP